MIPWGESIETSAITTRQTLGIPVVQKTIMVIRGPSPTPYESNKAVPWSYDSTVYVNSIKQECEVRLLEEPG